MHGIARTRRIASAGEHVEARAGYAAVRRAAVSRSTRALAATLRPPSATRRRAKRRLPSCRTRPSSRSAGESTSSAPSGSPSSLTPPCAEQPARLRARDPERLGEQRRQVHRSPSAGDARPRRRPRAARGATKQAVEVLPRRPRPPRRRGSASTSARASARLASRGGRLRRAARRAAGRTTPAIAASGSAASCRTSPRAASVTPMWLPSDFDIFSRAVDAGQDRHRQDRLLGLAVGALDVAAEQQVERLVGAAELDVGVDRPPSRSPAAADRAARAPRSARCAA